MCNRAKWNSPETLPVGVITRTPTPAAWAAANAASLALAPAMMTMACARVDSNSARISSAVFVGLIGAAHHRDTTAITVTASSGPFGSNTATRHPTGNPNRVKSNSSAMN